MADDVKISKLEKLKTVISKFFKDIISELKKVIWPSRSQLTNNTLTVFMTCLLVGVVIWGVDECLSILMKVVYKV